jgi:hypothetical protein
MNKTLIIETKQNHQGKATIEDFAKQKLQNISSELSLINSLLERDNTPRPRDLELAIYKILMEVDSTLFIYFGDDND